MAQYQLSAFADEASRMLSEQLEAMKSNGISLIEMRGVDGKSVADLTDEEAKEAKRKLDDAGAALSSLGSPYGKYPIEQPFEAHLDAFKRGLEITKILGANRIRMFSFFMPREGDTNPASWRGKVIDQLGQMLDLADDAGIRLCHENEKGIYGDIDDRCVDLMEVYGDRMGCIFDPANFIQCGVKPIEAFPKLEKYITYMHIKDALLENGAVVPAGMGDGNVKDILDRLAAKADNMTLTLEPHLTVFDGLKNLQDEKLNHKFSYPDRLTAFNAAVSALKDILREIGFVEGGKGTWTR